MKIIAFVVSSMTSMFNCSIVSIVNCSILCGQKMPSQCGFVQMDKKGAPKEYKEQSTWWRTCFEYQCSLWFIAAAHVRRVATQKKTKKHFLWYNNQSSFARHDTSC